MVLEEVIKQQLKKKCGNNINNYIQMTAEWFTYIILSKKRYEIDHSFDPPWDNYSKVVCTDKKLNLADYCIFNEFLENELIGESFASYISNHGLANNTYIYDFEEKTLNWIILQLELVIKDLIKDKNIYLGKWLKDKNILFVSEKADNIAEEIMFTDIVGDCISILSFEIIDEVRNANPHFLFK